MNIYGNVLLSLEISCKSSIQLCYHTVKMHGCVNKIDDNMCLRLGDSYLRPSRISRMLIVYLNAVVLIMIIC